MQEHTAQDQMLVHFSNPAATGMWSTSSIHPTSTVDPNTLTARSQGHFDFEQSTYTARESMYSDDLYQQVSTTAVSAGLT